MRKVVTVFLVLLLALGIVACSSGEGVTQNLEGSLEEILESIYETAETSEQFNEFTKKSLQITEINDENMEYYFGTTEIEFEAAIASEPMMMPNAYSLCLLRAKEGADVEEIKNLIKENVNPRKWICVGVDPSNVFVDSIGDVVFLVMSDKEGSTLYEAFLALGK